MKKSIQGFTLIEMLIVIAIVGILAAVALPLFQMYTMKARLAEAENGMAAVAGVVSTYRNNTESWPTCSTIAEVMTTLGIGLNSVTRIQAISIDGNGVITAQVNNINATVDGKTLTLTPSLAIDGSIGWRWGSSSDFPDYLRPKNNF